MKITSLIIFLAFFALYVHLGLGQALPSFPNEFSTQIEINLLERNATYRRAEYFDYDNNRERIDFYGEHGVYIEVIDYNKDIRYELTNFTNCRVTTLNSTYFRFREDLTTHHIRNASTLFHFGDQYNEVYVGRSTARGILCDVWTSYATDTWESRGRYTNYTVDYYFSVDEWQIHEGNTEHRVPVRAHVTGAWYNSDNDTLIENYEHIYEVTFFQVGTPSPWVFDAIPSFFRCGSLENRTYPSLPDQFETIIEYTNNQDNVTATIREFYDSINNRARVDFINHEVATTEIIDLNRGIRYEILNHWNCSSYLFNASYIPSGHLQNGSTLFRFGEAFGEAFQGIRTVRSIPCGYWVSYGSYEFDEYYSNYTVGYYFSDFNHKMIGEGYRIPLRMEFDEVRTYPNGTQRKAHENYDFIHFVPGAPRASVFHPPEELFCSSNVLKELPSLPNQYTAGIEFTITEKNYTGFLYEYFDYDNDRIRVELRRRGEHIINIIEIDDDIEYVIHDDSRCVVRPYHNNSFLGGHLQTTASFFHFGADFPEVYQGVRTVRGIPCDFWAENITQSFNTSRGIMNSTYTALYYFAVPSWSMRNHAHGAQTIVQIVITGTQTLNNTVTPFHHIYDFVDFVAGQPAVSAFVPLLHWNCENIQSIFVSFRLSTTRALLNTTLFKSSLAAAVGIDDNFIVILEIAPAGSTAVNVLVDIKAINQTLTNSILQRLNSKISDNTLNVGYASLAPVRIISSLECLNGCSSHGICHFGTCICNSGFSAPDCSIEAPNNNNQPP